MDPASFARDHGASPLRTYGAALRGFTANLNLGQLRRMERDPRVRYVEQDEIVDVSASGAAGAALASLGATAPAFGLSPDAGPSRVIQTVSSLTGNWGLDRIDQPDLPLDGQYLPTPTSTS